MYIFACMQVKSAILNFYVSKYLIEDDYINSLKVPTL